MQEKKAMLSLLLPLMRSSSTRAERGASLRIKWSSLLGTPSQPSKSTRSLWPSFSSTGALLVNLLSTFFYLPFSSRRAGKPDRTVRIYSHFYVFLFECFEKVLFYQLCLNLTLVFTDTRGNWLDKATGVPPGSIDSWFPLIWTLLLIVISRCILFRISLKVTLIISPYFTVLEAMASQIISRLNFVVLNRPTLILVIP